MEVTGQLRAPVLMPCPGRNDLGYLKDDRCQPVHCPRQPDFTGLDCCQTWKISPNVWTNEIVRVDHINPEKFKYDQYRYQVFAKPWNINSQNLNATHYAPDKQYVAPTTDVRALRQSMYIPMLPHNPRGVTEYTFPMTPQTMGEPDVTTACCVPVIPGNPGFQNMTSSVRQDPNVMCQTYNRCKQPKQLGPRRVNIESEIDRTQIPPLPQDNAFQTAVPPPQFYSTPAYNYGDMAQGQQQLFQQPPQPYDIPYPSQLQAPTYTDVPYGGSDGCQSRDAYSYGLDLMYDGINPQHGPGVEFTSVKNLRYQDRVNRAMQATAETQEQRTRRLKAMYGSFGSYLVSTPYTRRNLQGPKNSVVAQGHGFSWNYPKNENTLCYIIERNPRC